MWRERLGRILLVSRDEWPLVLWLCALSFLLVGGNVLGASAAVSLFLKRVGADRLPTMYPLASAAVLLGAFAYLRVVDRLPRRTVLLTTFAIFALLPLAMRLSIGSVWAVPLLFITVSFISQYSSMQFWLLASDLVDPRAAKRLFALANGGGSLGSLILGTLILPVAKQLGTENLLFLWSAALGCCFLLLWSHFRRAAPVVVTPPATSFMDDLRELKNVPITLPAAAVHGFVVVASVFIDFIYHRTAAANLKSEAELSAFIGGMYAIESLLAILLQFTVVGRLVGSVGVMAVLFMQPLVLLLPIAGLLARPGLWTATAARLAEQLFQHTTYGTASNAVFSAAPGRVRGRFSVFLRLVASPICVAGSGLIILAISRSGMQHLLIEVLAGLMFVWAFAALMLRRPYVATLVSNLSHDDDETRLQGLQSLQAAGEGPLVDAVRQALQSGDEATVRVGLELFGNDLPVALRKDLAALIAHPSSAVRCMALGTIPAGLQNLPARAMMRALHDPDAAVREAAVQAMERAAPAMLRQAAVERALEEDEARVLSRLLALLAHDGLEERHVARLKQACADADPQRRRWAAAACCGVDDDGILWVLDKLVEDAEPTVRLEALRSVAAMPHPRSRWTAILISGVHAAAFDMTRADVAEAVAALRIECIGALGRLGVETAGPICDAYIRYEASDPRRALIRALAEVGGGAAHAFLIKILDSVPPELEGDVVAALHGSVVPSEERGPVERSILRSVERALEAALAWDALQNAPDAQAVELVTDEMQREMQSEKTLVLEKLGLMVDAATMAAIRTYLEMEGSAAAQSRERALAVEVCENVLPLSLRGPVMALMDFRTVHEVAVYARAHHHTAVAADAVLLRMLNGSDPWLQASAAFAAGRLGVAAAQERLEELQDAHPPWVAETCRDALKRLH